MKAETLRKSILQYAIQGKLVPQVATEEPASVLLEKIKAEKQELIKQGKIKKEKSLPPITEDEKSFDIPDSWEWVRIESIAVSVTNKNNQIKLSEILKKGLYPVVSQGQNLIDGYSNESSKFYKIDTPLIMFGDHTRNVKFIDFDFIVGADGTKFLYPIKTNEKYLYYIVKYIADEIKNRGYARHYSLLKKYVFPLPPLAEQQRIVARIEELMVLVDQYEEKQIELEKLEKEFPDKLKKSILQYAIQGKLVRQIDTEEPASVLLDKIKLDKQELIKQGKIKKQKPLPPIEDNEKPFDIPDSWEWIRLGECVHLTSGQDMTPEMYYSNRCGIPYITGASNFNYNDLILNRWTKEPKAIAYKNDLLLTCKGTVGLMLVLTEEQVHIARQVMSIRPYVICVYYLKIYLESYINELKTKAKSIIPGIGRDDVTFITLPLPPLVEQQRIVARIEELFALVDLIANGVKLDKIEIDEIKPTSTAKVVKLPIKENKTKIDVTSLAMVARADSGVTQDDVNDILRQVQSFYDKKN